MGKISKKNAWIRGWQIMARWANLSATWPRQLKMVFTCLNG